MLSALRESGFDGSLQEFDWTGGETPLEAFCDRPRQAAEARRLAQAIARRAKARAGDEFLITGHSAGAAIAVRALEQLPNGVEVDEVVPLAPALSPDYRSSARSTE